MKLKALTAAVVTAVALSGSAFATTFTFDGTCAEGDCAGHGAGTLVLQDYTPGDEITSDNFVSFTYNSNLIAYNFNSVGRGGISGVIGSTPGAYNFSLDGMGTITDYTAGNIGLGEADFKTYDDGFWCTGQDCLVPEDFGDDHTWALADETGVSSAPEPGSWALMIFGVGFIGWALGYRKRVIADHKAQLAALG